MFKARGNAGWAVVAFLALQGAAFALPPGYADPASCATCHAAVAQRYAGTGMARTLGAMRGAAGNPAPVAATFVHAPSAETISVTRTGDHWRMERRQTGFDGSPTNVFAANMDYWFGSGNHARSYFSHTSRDELIELPLTWYSEKNGYWAMSPGYDSASHSGFTRKVSYRCVFCHSAYPDLPAGADRMDTGTHFPAALPQGIDCQRCHGPGLAHVAAAGAGGAAAEVRAMIVNPAKLAGERRDEVCLQCHLETTTMSLPASLPVYGRGVFSYVPGQPLGEYMRFFDFAPGTGQDDRFEFTGAPYRLRQSKCFSASLSGSAGRLNCITCHDPHEPEKGKSIARANAACVNCHRSLAAAHTASSECVSCHMPQRTPSDSIHTTVTDHLIRSNPQRAAAPIVELNTSNAGAYRGEVKPYYPVVPDIYAAVAQVRNRANLQDGIARVGKALAEQKPTAPEFYVDYADALRHNGDSAAAIPQYRKAILLDAGYWPAHYGLGLALAASGDVSAALAPLRKAAALSGNDSTVLRSLASVLTNAGKQQDALAVLRDAVAADPDSAETRNDLGTALARMGDPQSAEKSLREAVRLRPESAPIRVNLASLLARVNRFEEATFEFETAIFIDPQLVEAHSGLASAWASHRNYVEASAEFQQALKLNPQSPNLHNNLGAVLREMGDHSGAQAQYREAIRLDPKFATPRYNLAIELSDGKRLAEAEAQLKEAVRINPEYYAAHLRLAEILMDGNRRVEAEPHIREALKSPERIVAGRAMVLLKSITP